VKGSTRRSAEEITEALASTRFLHHDNAFANTVLCVQTFLYKTKTPVVPQPPYGPDLYPEEILMFLKQQVKLQGCQSKSQR
jgi:hypothetical protein